MRRFRFCSTVLVFGAIAFGQAKPQSQPTTPQKMSGFDISALDKSVDPCTDFYEFSCGGWKKANPIPRDQAIWGAFYELAERNREVLRQILEGVQDPAQQRDSVEQKTGDYYASCMDEQKVNALGAKPLEPEFVRIAAVKDRATLIEMIAHLNTIGVSALLSFYPAPDLHDATRVIANVDQGGLTLPDRDYYIKDDAKSVETRAKYAEHVQKMFELVGEAPEVAAAQAKSVLAVETELAKASMDRTARRDPRNRDHKMSAQELERLAPGFQFARFFAGLATPKLTSLNVANPEFFKTINAHLDSFPLNQWKTYLRWRLLTVAAPLLSSDLVNEDFRFFGQYIKGAKELQARWKRCVAYTDGGLGEALGKLYVDRTFGAQGKEQALHMVRTIEKAMDEDIQQLPWMSEETKKRAREKLKQIANNIGYPTKWRDYTKLNIVRGDFVGNALRANSFESARKVNKINKPVDRQEWIMTPPTVNAYYRPSMNDINFPAGILQPPFFDPGMDDAVNYGAIGSVIGHELTHGFDDQGAKYDPVGNLRDWWTDEDRKKFQERSGCFVDQYSKFVAVDDLHLNGKLTLGENIADNGGVRVSYSALKNLLVEKPQPAIDGFTPEQRFFLGYAQVWCQNVSDEQARLRVLIDPHSPGKYRVNGVVMNSEAFQKAFGCKNGQPMVSENACRVW